MIASGGAGSLEHFRDAFTEGGADAALAASVFHFAVLSVEDVKSYLRQEGVEDVYKRQDGWLRSSSLSPQELAARALDSGIRTVVYTDVSRDGTLRCV